MRHCYSFDHKTHLSFNDEVNILTRLFGNAIQNDAAVNKLYNYRQENMYQNGMYVL